jgi:hypothetical protein
MLTLAFMWTLVASFVAAVALVVVIAILLVSFDFVHFV